MIEVGSTVRYRTLDRVEVHAKVIRIDKVLDRLLVEYANGEMREWIQRNDVLYERGMVVVDGDGNVGKVRQVDRDGDILVGHEFWYRTRIKRA